MRRALLFLPCLAILSLAVPAQTPNDTPTAATLSSVLPDSPLKTRLRQLAERPPAVADKKPEPADLLRPELAFKPRNRWLLLPDLARQLADDDEQKEALLQLLTQGADAARNALAEREAANDVGAAAALFFTQLWQIARNTEIPEEQADRLHAQVVAALAAPEVAKMKDADKQRFWEYCIGYPIFVAAMMEVVEGEEAKAQIRQVASLAFESLVGVPAGKVEFGTNGIRKTGARTAKAAPAAKETPKSTPTPATAVPGIVYTDPAGWTREQAGTNLIFRATLGDVDDQGKPWSNNDSSHQATLGILPVITATQGPTALFDTTWREQFGVFELGDTVVHYRSRLPCKLVVLYMGRFFKRPNTPSTMGNPQTYGALYLVDLGNDRYQPLVALVEPRDPSVGMDSFKESAALKALSFPLGAWLDSIRPSKGEPPYPAGGYFAAGDLRGRWSESSSAYGGSYVNTHTGASAGAAVSAAAGHFHLLDDGSYEYAFSYYAHNPQFGNSGGSTKHSGRYRLDGDIVLIEPSKPIDYKFTCCAAGVGVRQTPEGPRRILVTVSAGNDGVFRAPPLIPNWDSYSGVMTWYCESPK